MITLAYLSAIFMGFVLGLLGGGGSILTVPILVYLFHVSATLATGYSLAVVGLTSAFAAFRYRGQGLLDLKIAVLFSMPSIIGVIIARSYLLPALPNLISIGPVWFTKDQFILLFFAALILLISLFMFKSRDDDCELDRKSDSTPYFLIAAEGLTVGIITGFVGAGGGFMIVPALVLLTKIQLRSAIATSLLIISSKSLIGFMADVLQGYHFDWFFLSIFLAFTFAGALLGTQFNKRLPAQLLRKAFAVLVLIMGLFIVYKELSSKTDFKASYQQYKGDIMTSESINIEEFVALQQSGQPFVLIDVREVEEFEEGSIEGADLIPLGTLHEELHRLDKKALTVMQCRSGRRSATAQEYLQEQGFTKVLNLEGGILAWDNYWRNKDAH